MEEAPLSVLCEVAPSVAVSMGPGQAESLSRLSYLIYDVSLSSVSITKCLSLITKCLSLITTSRWVGDEYEEG